MQFYLRKPDFENFLAIVVTGKEKGVSKLVTGKEFVPQIWLRKLKRVSNMITEINLGFKYGYGNKFGFQKWVQRKLSVTIFGTQIFSVTLFETPLFLP